MYSLLLTICCLLPLSSSAQHPASDTNHTEKMNVIFHEEVIPYLESIDSIPDWGTFGKHLITLYGDTGEEVLLLSQTIYSLQQDDWPNFSTAIIPYAKKYGMTIPAKQRHAFSEYMSRNAQLLYQSGRKEEGIRWQILALPLAAETDHAAMLERIEKMKNDQ
jgi:hypothetical protein